MTDNIKRIEYLKDKISEYQKDIKHYQDQIDILEGLTEMCPHCNGERRIMMIHRTFPPHKYIVCRICLGKGKITKERLQIYNREEGITTI